MDCALDPTRPSPVSRQCPEAHAARPRGLSRVAGGLATLLVLLGATTAGAVDGVMEINQASAMAGVGLGDAPGFPVTLALRGSYRLTGELNVPPDTVGIALQGNQIHLDMNGYSIVGGGGPSGEGIVTLAANSRDHRVSNGTIRSMGGDGVRLGNDSRVEGVTVIDCGGMGVSLGHDGFVHEVLSTGNGSVGIRVGESGVITQSVAKNNGDNGVFMDVEGLAREVTSRDNTRTGIVARNGGRVLQSNARNNGRYGFEVSNGVVIGSVASSNILDGIDANGATLVQSNSAWFNGGHGIRAELGPVIGNSTTLNDLSGIALTPFAGYGSNVSSNNLGAGGNVLGGVDMGGNVCGGSPTGC